MSNFVFIALDTTPPIIAVEAIDGTAQGERMAVEFSLNEPAEIVASIQDLDANVFSMDVAGRIATFDIPKDWPTGDYTLLYQATDVVGNASEVFSETISITEAVNYVHILLDTTPPTLILGDPTGLSAGQTLEIPFTPGDDAVGASAVLRDYLSREYPMDIEGTTAHFEIPQDFLTGDYTIVVTVVDDVGNPNSVSKVAYIEGVTPPAPTQPEIGGSRPVSLTPLRKRPKPVEEHVVETLVPVVVWCVKGFELSVPVEMRAEKIVEFSAEMSVACVNQFEMSISVVREPGLHFARILREDDELLLVF